MKTDAIHPSPEIAKILGASASRYSAEDIALFEAAHQFGQKAHKGQKRASGEPFFTHCVETARLLAELRMDPHTLAAGLLHDVLEDTRVTREQLDAEFEAPVGNLVEGVTKLSSLQFNSDHEAQVGTLRKMILAMARDVRVIIIKLCDRMHNMATLDSLSEAKQRRIARTTLDIYAPLANRLGMSRIRAELEDNAMRYLYPVAYADMRNRVARKKAVRESIVQRSIRTLREHLDEAEPTVEIAGRPKHFYGIYQKMRRQNLSFDEIYDLIALRIITDSVQDCYDVVGRVHALWHPVPGRFKDYIALPKENGYQSIHTTVIGLGGEVTEIQIRTHEMSSMAEQGIASHWRYKEEVASGQEEKLAWLRRLVGWLQDVRDPTEFMDALKQDVFSEVVFCFTPKGDVIELPAGSTVLDFAYYIHTEVGHHCSGVRINRKMVPIRSEIQMGDIVEVLQSRGAHPSTDWLEFVRTSRARNKIRHWLKSVNFDQNRRRGLDSLHRALRERHVEMEDDTIAERLARSFRSFRVASFEELLAEIGFGSISAASAAGRLIAENQKPKGRKSERDVNGAQAEILIEDLPNMATTTAKCCHPMPGDPIIGFVTRGRGVSVHRTGCPNLRHTLRSGTDVAERLVSAAWGQGEQPFQRVVFRIECEDRPGLLSDASQVFSALGLNIVETNTKSNDRNSKAMLRFSVMIQNTSQISDSEGLLSNIPGILSIVHRADAT